MKTNILLHPTKLFVLIALLLTCLSLTANAATLSTSSPRSVEDPTPTPTPTPTPDVELERLQRQTKISNERAAQAENDKKIAEAKKAEFDARFPKPSTSPLAGTTTISDGAVIESQIVSYVALRGAADKIVDDIRKDLVFENKDKQTINRNLAIFNERDVNLILSYRVADAQISIIEAGYRSLLAPPAAPGPGVPAAPLRTFLPAAQSFLGAFVDLTALLRTNVEIKGQTFVIDEGPLAAEIFRAARDHVSATDHNQKIKGELYYPYVFPIDVYRMTDSRFLGHLEETRRLRVEAEKLFDDLLKALTDLAEKNAAVKALEQKVNVTIPGETKKTVLQAANIIKAHCRALNAEAEKIKQMPDDKQAEAMVALIERARKECRRMNQNKLEELLGLGDTLKKLIKDLADAKKKLATAQQQQATATQTLVDLQKKLALGPIADPTDVDEVAKQAEAAITRLTAINAQFDSLVDALVTADAGNANALTNYIRTERLLARIKEDDYWLQLKVINAGGNNRIKTNLIVDIFRGGNRVSHSGGVIVQYHLFDSTGQSIRSGTVSQYTGYIDSRRVERLEPR